jgi:exopolyphosphatase/pppGpp-phosphohydrolase
MEVRMAETGVRDLRHGFPHRIEWARRWVARSLGTIRHEHRVLGIAVRLFDLLAPYHGLGHRHRRLLKLGALLHDVGRLNGACRHHITGAHMILQSPCLPLAFTERTAAAYLTRYHRKQVPEWSKQSIICDKKELSDLQVLLAILRAADALDSRRVRSRALTMRLADRRLEIHIYTECQSRRARRALEKHDKFQLLRSTLDISVKLRLRHSDVSSNVFDLA